ncbi:MAG: hypothetical protein OEY19_03620 [Gammaproteobacteria bacterium]|nr:hypothetical protein [Gammaproteobacteria bacterium]MDH5630321.1 hypothetical protein [Gammaproteobacteria bacterium]
MNINEKNYVENFLKNIEITHNLSELFFEKLFDKIPGAEKVFNKNLESRHSKFVNMISIFKNLKHYEKMVSAYQSLAGRHQNYSVDPAWYPVAVELLVDTLDQSFDEIQASEREMFKNVFSYITTIMQSSVSDEHFVSEELSKKPEIKNFLKEVGGEDVIKQVHQRFYDVIFEDEWLGTFFYGKNKPTLVRKQTEFMLNCLGNYSDYHGETPALIHLHMFITEDMFLLRRQMLKDAILSHGLSESVAEKWLYIDGIFRDGIVKKDISECVMKCVGQMPISAKKPAGYKYQSSVFYSDDLV